MSEILFDAVTRIARHEAEARPIAALAVVTEVHTQALMGADDSVTVELRDSGVLVPRVPVATGCLGLVATLAPDDLVLVVFADGDVHAGVVVGRLHHRDLPPPEHSAGQVVLQLPPGESSPSVDLKVDPADPVITLTVGSTEIRIEEKKVSVTIGDAELVVDGSSPGELSLTAGEATATFKGNGELSLEASQKLLLKGNQVEIKGDAGVKISGAKVDLN